jgi:glyoxylase-like metal-dependent hydrolase (beta-lactamase superfamily II)
MKLVFHYSVENFSNTYVIGPEEGGDALLVDPGVLDVRLLEAIESNAFTIRWVLITRCQPNHVRGLRTLKKVYDAEIYSRQANVLGFECQLVKAGSHLQLGPYQVDCLCYPELSHDTVVYKLENWVFCGDLISAGKPGKTTSPYAQANLAVALERRFFTWQDDLLVFPGEGPPTTLRSEKLFNLTRRSAGLEVQDSSGLPGIPEGGAP